MTSPGIDPARLCATALAGFGWIVLAACSATAPAPTRNGDGGPAANTGAHSAALTSAAGPLVTLNLVAVRPTPTQGTPQALSGDGTASAPSPGPSQPMEMPPGMVLVASVRGSATMTINGGTIPLHVHDKVATGNSITTGPDSQMVLAFSNGTTLQLQQEAELVIDEYLQVPFAGTIRSTDEGEEHTPSRTILTLRRGRMVGMALFPRTEQGAYFIIHCVEGWAGPWGRKIHIRAGPGMAPVRPP